MEPTEDGRYIVVDGRRWRATDPAIPEALRSELVAELMAARRAVRTDPDRARHRVGDAKIALGERGEPWWGEPTPEGRRDRLAATMRALLRHRDPESSICPSDAARVVGGPGWRRLMGESRSVAALLHEEKVLRMQQRGQDVSPGSATGPVRLRRGERWES